MESAGLEQAGLTVELDILYQLCCEEDAASSANAAAVSNLPSFSLSPVRDIPIDQSPPASPTVSLPTPLLLHIARLQSLCTEPSASLYSVVLARLLQLLPQPTTPLLFRLAVVQLLSLLMVPPATTATSCQSFFSSHLYRLASLLLPPSLFSSSVATAILRLIDALLASGGPIGRSVCVNVRKYVDGWREERERRRQKRQADDTMAYFAAGGEVDATTASTARAEVREDEADSGTGGGVIVAGKRRRRIEPDPSIADLFPSYPTADDEDKRATALIEQLRAEQKVGLTEKRLRAKGDSQEDEWRKEWTRWMEDEDKEETEEQTEAGVTEASEVRKARFWRQWEEGTTWRPFMPSSLAESKPHSSRPPRRDDDMESKEGAAVADEEVMELSEAEHAQVQAAANRARLHFSSTYFAPPPVGTATQPPHYVHPSRAVVGPFTPAMFQQAPMGLPFMPPFEQPPLHPFAHPHAMPYGMHR